MSASKDRVLVTGASGFVGQSLVPALQSAGYETICGSRDPRQAARRFPEQQWARFDTGAPESMDRALAGCRAVVYLVHELAAGGDYEAREETAAAELSRAAERAGVERIVYLGGVLPHGQPSRHLRSRITTGAVLRSGRSPTFELQAAMVIGRESESFKIVRDLSARLPVLLLPRWLTGRSQPVGIDDVTVAIAAALTLPLGLAGAHPLPGPEALTSAEILRRVALLSGRTLSARTLPFLSPALVARAVAWATSANPTIVRELILGLANDLTADDDGFWKLLPTHRRLAFDEAVRRALGLES